MAEPPRSLLRSRVGRLATRLGNVILRPIAERGWIGPWAVLEHVGRRTGRRYRTPLAVLQAGDRLVIPVPFGLGTQWVQNVLAAGGATLHWHGRELAVEDPRLVTWPEVRPLVRRPLRAIVWLTRVRDMVSVRPQDPAAEREPSGLRD
ncbi:MAG: nitroreductase family deazaflavin-dependent oxidoreductase [Chloroflexi bacterium]|nr:nitroreductase family deazaflavin-dependent oxidoreductase [Chloroflexota bacterium]